MLSRFFKSKALWWLMSALVALLLWSYVKIVQDMETTKQISGIKVNFINEDIMQSRGFSVVEGQNATMSVNVRGRVSDLIKLDNNNVVITADLSYVRTSGTQSLTYTVDFPVSVAGRVIEAARITNYVNIKVDTTTSRPVPVSIDLQGSVASNYLSLKPVIEPETIRVTGPTNILDTIAKAQGTLEITDADKTIDKVSVRYVLLSDSGQQVSMDKLSVDYDEVRVTVPILMTKDVPLKIDFIDGGGLDQDENITVKISPSSVKISGDPAVLNDINSIKLDTIDLAKLEGATTREYAIVFPDNTNNVSGEVSAQVSVEVVGVETRQIVVNADDVKILNPSVPSGYRIDMFTKQLTVKLRGPKASLDSVQQRDIDVSVDLAGVNLTLGPQTSVAKVAVRNHNDIGAYGEYSVVIEVVEEE